MVDKSRASIKEVGLVIGLAKSKRLAAMRQTIGSKVYVEPIKLKIKPNLNKNETAIQQARELINLKIAEIKATYPQGRQNKLFALRYGPEDKLSQLSLQQLFALLKITENLPKDIAEVIFLDGSQS
ncbi:MAG: hypothetical protein RQ733_13680 [Methyloprofundus sp.]|nr:hypothetical protein [Methyloprofundus sp.]MDT8427014.1 hypothetical protein [Methyloprofundus sp.]